ncbi:MAG: sigma factor-like helix-turn-helix DNA-binding protein [Candidatus Paceibacterota bacterium]
MTALKFNPKQITKRLISELPERAQDIIVKRFGLEADEIMTLEAIGNIYDITRERVRQIENHSLNKLAESETLKEHNDSLTELREFVHELGIVVPESELLGRISQKRDVQNHVYLLLRLGEQFEYEKEDRHFTHRWFVDKVVHEAVKEALHTIHDLLGPEDLVSEKEIIDWFRDRVNGESAPDRHLNDDEIVKRWLRLSKVVDRNPLGEWGLADSPNVRVKGVRDYAYLVIRQHGSPMHFTEVTKKIEELFDKSAHVATTHNELIKDNRFVLVGRGLYALKTWGYMEGVVKDVIRQILKQEGPMTRDEIVDRVLKERYVKPNTVVVNLQDADLFEKRDDGKYLVKG